LILSKIFKLLATGCQILRLKCIKFNFCWTYAPYPARGAYSTPQTFQLDLRGLLLRGEECENERGRKRRGPQRLVHTPDVGLRNLKKYPDCRSDLIGGAATQTFAPGGKHPRVAIVLVLPGCAESLSFCVGHGSLLLTHWLFCSDKFWGSCKFCICRVSIPVSTGTKIAGRPIIAQEMP